MRRLTAILFSFVLLFNQFGYRIVISCLQNQQERFIENQLDQEAYRDDQLISIKMALNLPYYTGSSSYERAIGSVSLNGQEYEYVKQRIYQDTLELLCLPNPVKAKLKLVGNEVTKSVAGSDAPLPVKKNKTGLKISLIDTFIQEQLYSSLQVFNNKNSYTIGNEFVVPDMYPAQPEHPPQANPAIS